VQAGLCSYALDRTTIDGGRDESGVSVTLTTDSSCSWTATASEGWLRALPSNGTGGATIRIEWTTNTGGTRTAFVTIAGVRVTVSQQGS
jgi:hypothetical protein